MARPSVAGNESEGSRQKVQNSQRTRYIEDVEVTPSRDDDSAEAFQCFRRGVTRALAVTRGADGSHELQLLQLEQKQKANSKEPPVEGLAAAGISGRFHGAQEMDILSQLPDEPLPEETKEAIPKGPAMPRDVKMSHCPKSRCQEMTEV
eukprot:Skav227262  [mRNA]  locus=scaffold3417:76914:84467:- [translate_table: standard]